MSQPETVVRNRSILTKQELHAKIMAGWARGIAAHGKGSFADKLQISAPALDKQLTGSMPGLECIDKAIEHEPSVLDDWFAAKGLRIVSTEAVCDVDDASILITRLLLWLHEAEHPNSPGGRNVVHTELLPAEFMIRQLHQATGDWLAEISKIRSAAA